MKTTHSNSRMMRLFLLLVLPIAVYGAAILLITAPDSLNFSRRILGAGYGDSFEPMRLAWWFNYAFRNGLNPFQQSLLAYPEGFFSATQWAQPLIYVPTALLGFILDPTAAFNVWLLIVMVLNGMSLYWFCRELLRDVPQWPRTLASLIGGLVFMAFPTMQGQLSSGQINPLSLYGIPIALIAALRILDGRSSRREIWLGGLALWITGLGNYIFAVFVVLPIALFGVAWWLATRQKLTRRMLAQLLAMCLLSALLLTPFYAPLLAESLSGAFAGLREGGSMRYSTDLLAFAAPSPFTTFGKTLDYSHAAVGSNATEGAAYLGVVTLALVGVALITRQKRASLWLVIAFGCGVFSLGPILKVNGMPLQVSLSGVETYLPLPWALLQELPVINISRTPGRFNLITGMMLGILASLGASVILPRLRRKSLQVVISVVACLLMVAEYQLFAPFPTHPAAIPKYFYDLAQRADLRAVLEVPASDLLAQKFALHHQMAHHKPLVLGHVWRRTPVDPAKAEILSAAALGKAFNLMDGAPLTPRMVRALLHSAGADVIVYHFYVLDRAKITAYAESIFGPPIHTDQDRAIFEVREADSSDLQGVLPAAYAESGWWHGSQAHWIQGDAALSLYAPSGFQGGLKVAAAGWIAPRNVHLLSDGQIAAAKSIAPEGKTQFMAWLKLNAGYHTLTFTTPEDCIIAPRCALPTEKDSEACRAPESVESVCVAVTVMPVSAEAIVFEDASRLLARGLSLAAYQMPDAAQAGETVRVITAWQATQPLAGDYHLFVHLIAPDGTLAAQDDFVPARGAFPTSNWAENQRWIEAAYLNLPQNLPEGAYQVYVGWYSYPDGTRLAVLDNGRGAADGLVHLGQIQVK
ncbi:MAG: hypothetical protein OHK0023_09350 [Anaerolineae bacterium]